MQQSRFFSIVVPENYKKEIHRLVVAGEKSALFDKALLNYESLDYLALFRDFKAYVDVTGDLARIDFYTQVYMTDRPIEERLSFYETLFTNKDRFTEFEWNAFADWLKPPSHEIGYTFITAPQGESKNVEDFVASIFAGRGVNFDSAKKYGLFLKDPEAIDRLLYYLVNEHQYSLAYELFDKNRNLFRKESLKGTLVERILYYSGHYQEFLGFYEYHGPSVLPTTEMYVVSLWRTGKVEESLRVFRELIDASSLRTPLLRVPGSTNHSPAFFNMVYFYYFGGMYNDFQVAEKTELIEGWIKDRYRRYGQAEKEDFFGSGK